jgi:tetratricopeptide (TPR) repeat protein
VANKRNITDDPRKAGVYERWPAPLAVWVAAMVVFVATLAPTVTAEDSGELIAAAYYFGIPHPPGYPLWTMLCGLFVRLVPVDPIAWRANFFSATCAAFAAVVAYAALRELRVSRSAAAVGGLVWIWTHWAWKQAVIAEVYSLNALLTAAVFWAALCWYRTRREWCLVAAGLMAGLGMSNHHQIAFACLALMIWVLWHEWRLLLRWRLVALCIGAFVLGLLPYIYLPLRAASDPPMNWGDPSTAERFWAHVSRAPYGELGPTRTHEPRSAARFTGQMKYTGGALADDLTWPGTFAAIAAFTWIVARSVGKKRRPSEDRRPDEPLESSYRAVVRLVVLWLLSNVVLFVFISNFELDRPSRWAMRVFFIPAHLAAAVTIAVALDALGRRLRSAWVRWPAMAVIPVVLLVMNGPRNNYSNYWLAWDHARNMLDMAPPDTLLFPRGDFNTFPLVYLSLVEGYRPDVTLARKYGHLDHALFRDRPADSPVSPLQWVMTRRPRPICYTFREDIPVANARLVPAGLLFELVSAEEDIAAFTGLWSEAYYRNLKHPTAADLYGDQILAAYFYFGGLEALALGDFEKAMERFERCLGHAREIKEVINNVGIALGEAGREDLAIQYCQAAADLDPYYVLPRWNLFGLYMIRGETEEARRQLENILAVEPNNARARAALDQLDTPGANQ